VNDLITNALKTTPGGEGECRSRVLLVKSYSVEALRLQCVPSLGKANFNRAKLTRDHTTRLLDGVFQQFEDSGGPWSADAHYLHQPLMADRIVAWDQGPAHDHGY
jgi:hypothetical protein